MRGFAAGIVVLVFVVISVLSLRPGGLRTQLRNVARRLRLALTLAGIFLVSSTVLRLAFPDSGVAELVMVGLAVVLAVTFLILGQDRQLDRR